MTTLVAAADYNGITGRARFFDRRFSEYEPGSLEVAFSFEVPEARRDQIAKLPSLVGLKAHELPAELLSTDSRRFRMAIRFLETQFPGLRIDWETARQESWARMAA